MYAFRIALAEEQNLLIKERYSQGHQLSNFFHPPPQKLFLFNTRKICRKGFEKSLHNFKQDINK